ncbi:hypothetical protein BpHYR1_027353 [Brachionus plicatilis]|uniref:Uncharacterized protein n=1 Tax=Brachionus plicatilis TaxID=10195 RepID=A0A3M7PY72_BRAPC|nr:hypothetical protein BpHYR1_027353 [Brachionus plicatilis]
MIKENVGSHSGKMDSCESINGEKVGSRRHKEIVSDIFRTSRIRHNSIKLPKCNISRGLLMAIVLFILFSILIIWFIFSNDAIEENIESKWQKSLGKNDTVDFPLYDYALSNDKLNLSNKLFILFTTVFIVLAIVSFVFIGALVHYFQKPKFYGTASRSQSIVSSIFSHHNHHNHLYYLDRDIIREDQMEKKKRAKKKSKKLDQQIDEIASAERNILMNPTIIINEIESL